MLVFRVGCGCWREEGVVVGVREEGMVVGVREEGVGGCQE
jgi:hypothetical protein